MTEKEYLKRMKQHENSFDKLWSKIVKDTNAFIEKNPGKNLFSMSDNRIDRLVDSMCLSGAWIEDRINGKSGIVNTANYRGSRTKKIRKALGYTF